MPSGGNFSSCNCGPDTPACDDQTQPVATVGLCLADGTPIAVTVVRDCAGLVTSEGWINLASGDYSTGQPPAGTISCGDSRSITTNGTFCDVDADSGDVLGLVLVEYQYAADGSIDTVRLVDAVTSDTYTPQGEVTTCPAGTEQPERDLAQLCDVTDDESGTTLSVPFVRDYQRDETGQITGHTDYTLNGDPYTVTGTVTVCAQSPGETEPCRDAATVLLCDVPADDGSGEVTASDAGADAALYPFDSDPIRCVNPLGGGGATLWDGGALLFPAETTASGTCDNRAGGQVLRGVAATLQAPAPACHDGTVDVTVSVRVANGSTHAAAANYNGSLRLHRSDTGARLAISESLLSTPAGAVATLTATATGLDASLLDSGQLVVVLDVETFDGTTAGAVKGSQWTADQFTTTYAYGTAGCEQQFLRRIVTDCETGETVSVSDTTLDGAPYEATGEVGQCATTGDGASPTSRVDVESDVLCIRNEAGDITSQVVVERVYDDQTGDRTVQRLTDPTTGEPIGLPAGSELVVCNEPECPVAFSTECVGIVERTEASYDNTSLIGGVPGQCGGVQGPGGQFPCQPTTGGLTITSWIVDGEEVIGDGGREFAGGPCGQGTDANRGMHRNWAAALTNLDPSGATWTAQTEPACLWFVGSTGGTQTTYGPMVVEDADGQQWTLSPAQACEETQFTKVYSQDCDGSVSVSWLDADGVATDAPEGQQVPCGTGCGSGGGRGLDVETLTLCDIAEDGNSVPFLRHITYGSTGQVTVVVDTALDGFAPYTPTGVVGVCGRSEPLTVLEECRCDDTDGDGAGETSYVELIAVEEDGALRRIGTYTDDLSGPYTPVSPVPCDNDSDITPVRTVQPHRVQLAPGASWSADQAPTLQSVTATAHGGSGVITTEDGDSTLHTGESVTWSTSREGEYRLVGPLTIAADTGTVTVAYTTSA